MFVLFRFDLLIVNHRRTSNVTRKYPKSKRRNFIESNVPSRYTYGDVQKDFLSFFRFQLQWLDEMLKDKRMALKRASITAKIARTVTI